MNPPITLLKLPVRRKRASMLLALGGYANTAILAVQGFILIPLYLHFIGAHLYGLWLSSGGILAMLGVLQFGLGSMLIQRVAHAYGQQDLPKVGAYFVNGMIVYFVIVSVFTAVGLFLPLGFIELFKVSGADEKLLVHCFQLAVIATGIGMFNECLRGFTQAVLRPLLSMITLVIFRLCGFAGTVLLLYREAGLWAIPLGMIITEVLVLLSGIIQTALLFREFRVKILVDNGIIKEYFKVGGALFVAKLGQALSRESDPIMITLFLRPEVTTAYMVTRRAADIAIGMLSVLNASVHGAFSHLVGQGDEEKIREVTVKLLASIYFMGLIGFVSYVGMNYSFVSLWVGKSYALDQQTILFIGIAFFLSSLRNIALQIPNGFGDFNMTSLITFIDGLVKTLLAALFINYVGVIGAPLSLIIASTASLIIVGYNLKNRIKFKLNRRECTQLFLVVFVLYGIGGVFASFHESAGSWLMFALFFTALIITASMTCVLANWTVFRGFIKAGLCKQ